MDLSKVTQQEGGRAELCLKVLWDAPPNPRGHPHPNEKVLHAETSAILAALICAFL